MFLKQDGVESGSKMDFQRRDSMEELGLVFVSPWVHSFYIKWRVLVYYSSREREREKKESFLYKSGFILFASTEKFSEFFFLFFFF